MAEPKDVWVKVNLDTVFPGKSDNLKKLSEAASKVKFDADKVVVNLAERGQAATATIEVSAGLIDALIETGIEYLPMLPRAESFNNRIGSALNKPDEDEWSAGIIIMVQGPSFTETAKKYKALLDVMTSSDIGLSE